MRREARAAQEPVEALPLPLPPQVLRDPVGARAGRPAQGPHHGGEHPLSLSTPRPSPSPRHTLFSTPAQTWSCAPIRARWSGGFGGTAMPPPSGFLRRCPPRSWMAAGIILPASSTVAAAGFFCFFWLAKLFVRAFGVDAGLAQGGMWILACAEIWIFVEPQKCGFTCEPPKRGFACVSHED